MTLTAEPPVAAEIDPRDPELRLSKLLDAGSMHARCMSATTAVCSPCAALSRARR